MRSSGNTENTLLSFFLTATVFLVTIVGIEVWMELQGKRLSLESEIKPIREMVMPADKQGPLSLKSEHFEVENTNPGRFESTVRNEVRDNADTRERSNEGSTSKPFNTSDRGDAKDADQTVRELEAQLLNNSGGAAERAKIEQKIREVKSNATRTNSLPGGKTTTNKESQFSGSVLVEYKIYNQSSSERSGNYVPAPGYTCKQGSGKVFIDIQVNNGGKIITVTYNASKSSNASQCMISKALEYAKKSTFNYSANQAQRQGYILYTFVSQ